MRGIIPQFPARIRDLYRRIFRDITAETGSRRKILHTGKNLFAAADGCDPHVFNIPRAIYLQYAAVRPQTKIPICILDITDSPVRHEVLNKLLCFARADKSKIRLIVGKTARHKLDIRPVFVGQVSVPCLAEFSAAPRPLLFARRYLMICNVIHPGLFSEIITAYEVKVRPVCHKRSRNRDIFITGNIHPRAVIHFVILACRDRVCTHRTPAVIKYSRHIGRHNSRCIVVHLECGICPPEECLVLFAAIIDPD